MEFLETARIFIIQLCTLLGVMFYAAIEFTVCRRMDKLHDFQIISYVSFLIARHSIEAGLKPVVHSC